MKLTVERHGCDPVILEYTPPALLSSVLCAHGGAYLDMPCGGRQTCLKCKVTAYGGLSEPGERERGFLTPDELNSHIRYACMAEAVGDATVVLEARERDEIRSDIPAPGSVEPWENGMKWGAAFDIGTTTVAALLYDLRTGTVSGSAAMRNPQTAFGADVITRIGKAMSGEGGALAHSIRAALLSLTDEMCMQAGISRSDIDAVSIAGNTAMMYLLCGYDPSDIAAAPFEAKHLFGKHLPPDMLGFDGMDADIYLAPCVSAYIGGDITAAALAENIRHSDRSVLMVDIGTNGEMVLNTGSMLTGCSTAAGPAFEGAGIAMGMRAANGAVDRVYLDGGHIRFHVIGGGEARGLCGSGLIDTVAVMLEAGIIDETGYLLSDGHPFEGYIVSHGGDTAMRIPGTQVVITQKDVRALQLGKSAICAGILTLLENSGLCADDVTELIIAGGFGSFLDVSSAARIGLIPSGFAKKARSAGNAALRGAAMLLLDRKLPDEAAELAAGIKPLELSTDPVFMEQYVERMMFDTGVR